ncbi:ABC transporter permease [Methanomicrobium antiquum]|uniref:ABC transporter permease n=1 Tax=Methanomicrobium antiquum TaxID=487686 RepID=A0AAF0JU55_9EURY|nr:ABC transporter permease [Methanomicrobium antiquum]MDD3977309.1 ABC transporter permease [Methanomicrobium sp.]WFN37273.1 ABC transporter permease [Methanomicrobium antiquum]
MASKKKDYTKKILFPAATLIGFLLIWQLIAEYYVGNPFLLPSFTDIVSAFWNMAFGPKGTLLKDLEYSLLHFAIGMCAAIAVGIPVGIAMGWFKEADMALNPLIELFRPIPPLAWIPFAIIWFGLTNAAAGFIIFIGAVFPILVNTYTGFKGVPKVFIEAGMVLGCTSSLSLIRRVAFPSAIPSITSGIRISMGVGWMCLVGAEIFGAGSGKYGLGKNLWTYYNLHQMPNVVVYMVILGLIGLLIDLVFRRYVNRQMLKWQDEEL